MNYINNWFAKFSKNVADKTSSFWSFTTAIVLIVGWLLTGPMFNYSDTWQLIINTSTTIITFLMVFVIQNTQSRESRAMQVKLDELIIALAKADKVALQAEKLNDEELDVFEAKYDEIYKQALGNNKKSKKRKTTRTKSKKAKNKK